MSPTSSKALSKSRLLKKSENKKPLELEKDKKKKVVLLAQDAITPKMEKAVLEIQEEKDDLAQNQGLGRYLGAVGRRKMAIARVRLYTKGEKEIVINERPYQQYFPTRDLQQTVADPLVKMKNIEKFRVTARVSGGGMKGQAEAVRHGISRALIVFNQDFKKRLRRAGFLTRDPRVRERKKFGFKSARRAPQWHKR
jgi:small subunit ribosomal protein S9